MRLLICDDNKLFLNALSMALTDSEHKVVATALDPDEAVKAAREHQPDVCLLDVSFPNADGLNAIGRIHRVSPHTKVVMLSGTVNRDLVTNAITQGAQGFVGKEKPVGVIVEALDVAYRGHLAVDLLLLHEVLEPQVRFDDPLKGLELLTDREWEVLYCILEGLSNDQIADRLGVRPSTATSHVQSMLTKLGVHSRLQAAALMNTHASVDSWPAHMR